MMSPQAKGLFQHAIIQSAGAISMEGQHPTLVQKEIIGLKAAERIVLSYEQLMATEAYELYFKLCGSMEKLAQGGRPFETCVDGYYLHGDSLFTVTECNTWLMTIDFAKNMLRMGHNPVYLYHFNRMMPGNDAGAFHSAELWYVFGTLERNWRAAADPGFTAGDWLLSGAMTDYWCAFAKNGDSNCVKQPEWKPYTGADKPMILLNEKEISLKEAEEIAR